MSYQTLKLLLALLLFPLAVIMMAGGSAPTAHAEAKIGYVGVLEWNGEDPLDEFVAILNSSEEHTITLDGHSMDLDSGGDIGFFLPNDIKLRPCEYVYIEVPDYTLSALGPTTAYLYGDDDFIADTVSYPYYDHEPEVLGSMFEFGEEWLSEDDAGTCGIDELRINAGYVQYGFCSDLMPEPANTCNAHNYLLPVETGFDGEYTLFDYGLGPVKDGSWFEIDHTYQDGTVPPKAKIGSSSPDPSNPSTATPQPADPAPAGPVAAEPVAAEPAPAPIATPSPQSPPANSPMVLDPGNSAKDDLIVHLQERNEDLEAENDSLRLLLSDLLSYLGKMQEMINDYGIHADSP